MKCWVFLCIFIGGKAHSALAGTSDLRKKHQKMLSESISEYFMLCIEAHHLLRGIPQLRAATAGEVQNFVVTILGVQNVC